MNYLNTDRATFLVKFAWKSTNNTFIFQDIESLIFILENYDVNGIEHFKELDTDNKFKRVSKHRLLTVLCNGGELEHKLRNHYYFN